MAPVVKCCPLRPAPGSGKKLDKQTIKRSKICLWEKEGHGN